MSAQSSIRIIGGKWRSRKVSFETKDLLRPTPDRVRETLFNWLAPYIVNAVCLDLFAGSGVLGFEALSRGAKSVVAVEKDNANVLQIEKNQAILNAPHMLVLNKDVLHWLHEKPFVADIVFVDPPYKLQILTQTLDLLEQNAWVKEGSLIYFEQDAAIDQKLLAKTWNLWRQSRAGNVYYYVARKEA